MAKKEQAAKEPESIGANEKVAKTSTERSRESRARKKAREQVEEVKKSIENAPKSDAERMRGYRARKKAQEQAEQAAQDEAAEREQDGEEQALPSGWKPGSSVRPTVADAEAANGTAAEAPLARVIERKYGKSQTWACIMYADSAPDDYEDKLREIGVAFALSPWHDKDIDRNGKIKKAHRHVILHWPGGSTTYRTAEGIARGLLRGTIPVPLVSPRGYYRYFTHLDNPKKAQYDEADIVTGNGFDIGDFAALTKKEIAVLRVKIIMAINELGMTEYSQLVDYAIAKLNFAENEYICNNTVFWKGYLQGKWHEKQQALEEIERKHFG